MTFDKYKRFEKSMTNIKPNEAQIKRIELLRIDYKSVLTSLDQNCKDCRELSLALTKLEESLMWAVKSIVLEGVDNQ